MNKFIDYGFKLIVVGFILFIVSTIFLFFYVVSMIVK